MKKEKVREKQKERATARSEGSVWGYSSDWETSYQRKQEESKISLTILTFEQYITALREFIKSYRDWTIEEFSLINALIL